MSCAAVPSPTPKANLESLVAATNSRIVPTPILDFTFFYPKILQVVNKKAPTIMIGGGFLSNLQVYHYILFRMLTVSLLLDVLKTIKPKEFPTPALP